MQIICFRKQEYTSIWLKSAPPTPTIRMDRGRSDAITKASLVSWRSVRTPSCRIVSKLFYCKNKE